MNNLYSFLTLIRFKNLLIITLIQLAIKFFLINAYLKKSALNNNEFLLYLLALITIISAGYIINDIYDIETDKINKPETRVIDKKLNKDSALKSYYLLNLIGLCSGFYVAYRLNKLWLGFIFIYFIISLWRYSKQHKTSFLIGNLQVSFLTSLSIINLALYDLVPLGIRISDGSKIILLIILFYALFSFIITLIREIIKDIEDINGDRNIHANTIPIKLGIHKAKNIAISLICLPILGIAYFQYFQYSVLNSTFSIDISYWGASKIPIIYTLFIQLILFLLVIKTKNAETKKEFHFASMLCKVIMLLGILSIPLFTYFHIT
ncbi:MAG: prenyltransferase [Flavobacteriales bacterium]|nr:prenyltransferase [Flavobacteriales bacterium]|tara:strand:- start:3622 stop:4584 length:963 start_codon:yes stop_codon:yes gene_type:complete